MPYLDFGPWPFREHDRGNPSSGTKVAFYFSPHWTRPSHNIIQHLIDNVLLKNPEITIGLQIFLKRFEFQTKFVGHVADGNHAEIRQSRLRADRSKFRVLYKNLVSGKLVGPGFDLG